MNAIELHNVYLRSENTLLLEDISFSIKEGELCSIMGTSGSGKSTLLKVINGLAIGVEGEVLVNGQNIYRFSPPEMLEYHTRCGFIFQNAALINNMSVMENLALGFQYHSQMSTENVLNRLEPYLDYFEIPKNLLNQRPGTLSTGEKMLLSIVRAISKEPDFIFWDQPLASLDHIHQKKVVQLIERYKEEKRTMILVTNHAQVAREYADQIGVLESGRFLAFGSPKALRRSRQKAVKKLFKA